MFKSLTNNFHFLRFQMISVMSIFMIPIFFIGLISTQLLGDSNQQAFSSYSRIILDQLCGSIDLYLTDMMTVGVKINDNVYLQKTLKAMDFSSDGTDYKLNESNMMSFLSGLNFVRSDISGIFLYNKSEIVYYKRGENIFTRPVLTFGAFRLKGQKWFESLQASKENAVILGPGYVEIANQSTFDVFSVAKKILDLETGEIIGYLLINMELSRIHDICKNALLGQEDRILVLDHNGNLVYSTAAVSETQIEQLLTISKDMATEQLQPITLDNKRHLFLSRMVKYSKWQVIQVFDEQSINKNVIQYTTINLLTILFGTLIAIAVDLIILKRFVSPITNMQALMKRLERGDFSVRILEGRKDEIGQLASSFNNMAEHLNKLISEVYEGKIKERDAQFKALQSQINPHFLYNTLESIHMMAEINDDREVSRMVSTLGKIFRYSIKGDSKTATLEEELDYVINYVAIEQVRFGNIFAMYVCAPPETMRRKVLRLSIQPIVENAILHGFRGKSSGGYIFIHAFETGGKLMLSIADNGCGIPPDKVNKLKSQFETAGKEDEKASIGLSNVNGRLKTFFGESYGLELHSAEGAGTEVILRMPIME